MKVFSLDNTGCLVGMIDIYWSNHVPVLKHIARYWFNIVCFIFVLCYLMIPNGVDLVID